jgi:hypothetical protein
MIYLFIASLFMSSPVMADFYYREDVSYAQEMMVPGESVIDGEMTDLSDKEFDDLDLENDVDMSLSDKAKSLTIEPQRPQVTKKVLKQIPMLEVKRSIADDRIEDGYVQDMIKQNFNFNDSFK